MVFSSDKQRKAVMAKLSKGKARSNVSPTMNQPMPPSIRERLRRKFRPTVEELRKQRGERIKKEAEALKEERARLRQLELEAGVETEREAVRTREEEARAKLRKIDIARREKTFAGRVLKIERGLVKKGIAVAKKELAKKPRKTRARARARPAREETGFFGI